MNKYILNYCLAILLLVNCTGTNTVSFQKREKTCFQTSGPWKPVTDIRADVAIIYGANDRKDLSFIERMKSWQEERLRHPFYDGNRLGRIPGLFYRTMGWEAAS